MYIIFYYMGGVHMAEETPDIPIDDVRVKYGFWIVIFGLLMVLAVFIIAVLKWDNAADATAAIGAATGVIGTLVGTFFGIHVGAEGKSKEMAARKDAEELARHLAGHLDPEVYKNVLKQMEDSNQN